MLMIDGKCDGAELDKRFYMPGIILASRCPKCDADWESDLSNNYIKQYPVIGEPMSVNCYCEKCYHEWNAGKVVIRLSLEIVPKNRKNK